MLDSSAWIEVLQGTEIGKIVQKHLDKGTCMTPSIVLAEVCSKAAQRALDTDLCARAIRTTPIVALDAEIAHTAGLLHAHYRQTHPKFALSDGIVLATARSEKKKVLTKDTDFCGIHDAVVIG